MSKGDSPACQSGSQKWFLGRVQVQNNLRNQSQSGNVQWADRVLCKSLKNTVYLLLSLTVSSLSLCFSFCMFHCIFSHFLPHKHSHRSRQMHQPAYEITVHNSQMKVSAACSFNLKVIGRSPPSACQRGQNGTLRWISISLSHSYTYSWLLAVWEAHRTLPWTPSSQICCPN